MVGTKQRVYLHIGTPKSGTTYLQEFLWRNRDALLEAGVRYPGGRPDEQFLATIDLLEREFHGHRDPATDGAWDRVADKVRAWPRTSVISHEMLAPASPEQIRRAIRSMGDAEVHIVCTARDLARQLPAVWQEDIKNCGALTFDEFSRSVRGVDDSINPYFANVFWGYQDLPKILRAWSAELPPERVHVLPLPRGAARNALWLQFAEILGVDPAAAPNEIEVRNPSTGVVETNLLRLLNKAGVTDLDWPSYNSLVKLFLAVDVLAGRPGSVPLTLPVEDRAWVEQWSKDAVEAVRAAGYHVLGDLNDLLPAWRPDHESKHPDGATEAELLDAAVYALAATLRMAAEERKRHARERDVVPPPATLRDVLRDRYGDDPKARWMLRRYRDARAAVRSLINGR